MITLYVYAGADGFFNLYEDEGTNYNYEKGAFTNIPINYSNATKTLTIGDRKGSFNGMLKERKFNIVWVTKENKTGIDNQRSTHQTVNYSGDSISIRRK